MSEKRKALLLVNVGTPDSPEVPSVRRYLRSFLNDPLVIDLPWVLRKILVNLIIIPFRVRRSSALYKRLWTPQGSPLLFYLRNLVDKLTIESGEKYAVKGAMRYGNPSIENSLKEIRDEGLTEVILFPLYPHYSLSTTKTVTEYVSALAKIYGLKLSVVNQFYDHEMFLQVMADRINSYNLKSYDHLVFSYHGLPVRQVEKIHPSIMAAKCNCSEGLPAHGHICYRATCYETTRLLAGLLRLKEGTFSTAFQSRLSKNWLEPFSDRAVATLAGQGVKSLLVVSPSFVADCLETTIEIGEEYREIFLSGGGEKFDMVSSLNDTDSWVAAIGEIVSKALPVN